MVQENSLKLIMYGALIILTLVGAFGCLNNLAATITGDSYQRLFGYLRIFLYGAAIIGIAFVLLGVALFVRDIFRNNHN